VLLDFSLRAGAGAPPEAEPPLGRLLQRLAREPQCLPVRELASEIPPPDLPLLARQLFHAISSGWVRPRIEPVRFPHEPPERPRLDGFRRLCASANLPLVDAYHVPCTFPAEHHPLLAAMDGTRTRADLAELARACAPRLDLDAWLSHLASRGLFENGGVTSRT
jgi:hypothetical protein